MTDFDPKQIANTNASKLGPKLGKHGFDELRAMEEYERGTNAPRKNMLELLQGEIAARMEASPGLNLSAVSKARIASSWLRYSSPELFGDLSDEDKGLVFQQVTHALETPAAAPADEADEYFRRYVGEQVPLLLEIEALQGARVREVIADGDMAAKGDRQAATLIKDIAKLAFCDAAGEVLFKIEPQDGDLLLRGTKAVYAPGVTLEREKPRVDVQQVVALSAEDRRIARVRWAVPLTGGGGRLAHIPAGYIAFNL